MFLIPNNKGLNVLFTFAVTFHKLEPYNSINFTFKGKISIFLLKLSALFFTQPLLLRFVHLCTHTSNEVPPKTETTLSEIFYCINMLSSNVNLWYWWVSTAWISLRISNSSSSLLLTRQLLTFRVLASYLDNSNKIVGSFTIIYFTCKRKLHTYFTKNIMRLFISVPFMLNVFVFTFFTFSWKASDCNGRYKWLRLYLFFFSIWKIKIKFILKSQTLHRSKSDPIRM